MTKQIKAYACGQTGPSPPGIADSELLNKRTFIIRVDEKNLRTTGIILKDQTDQVPDLYYNLRAGVNIGFIACPSINKNKC